MKTSRKLLSLILALIMVFGMIPAVALTSSAQECAWTLEVNGEAYSSSASYAVSGQLKYYGGVVYLNGFSGQSIAAIPGGNYPAGDDAPHLKINVSGTNSLSGSEIDGAYTALYAEPLQGGDGEESIITITGSGTLNINITKNLSKIPIKAIVAKKEFKVTEGAKVFVEYGGSAESKTLTGIDTSAAYVEGNSVLDIKATATALRTIVGGKVQTNKSKSDVYGVSGRVVADTNGYVSINTNTSSTSDVSWCATETIYRKTNTTPVYLENKLDKPFSPNNQLGTVPTDYYEVNLNPLRNYRAIFPKAGNSSLKPMSWKNLFAGITYPVYGEEKGKFDDSTFYQNSNAGAYYMNTSYVLPYGVGSGTSSNFEKYADKYYSFRTVAVPMPGYYLVAPTKSDYMYSPEDSTTTVQKDTTAGVTSAYYANAVYNYNKLTITEDIGSEYCSLARESQTTSLTFKTNLSNSVKYQWYVGEMLEGGVMIDKYEDFEYQGVWATNNKFSINGGTIENDFRYSDNAQELEGIEIYCEATLMPSGQTVSSQKAYYNWGHIYSINPSVKDAENHARICADPICDNVKAGSAEKHTDANNDGKCDKCGYVALSITAQPKALTVNSRDKITFSAKAKGENLTYKWYREKDGSVKPVTASVGLTGATSDSFTYDPTAESATNNLCSLSGWSFFCKISNGYETVETQRALLTVNHTPVGEVASKTEADHSFKCYCGQDIKEAHTFEYTVTKAATCTEDGLRNGVCKVCGYAVEEKVNKAGHNPVEVKAVAATCTKTGLTAGKKCSVCGIVLEGCKEAKMLEHTYKTTVTKKADVAKKTNGKLTKACSVCGKVNSTTTVYYPKSVSLSFTSKTYTGKALTPKVTVKDSKGKVIDAKYYTVKVTDNVKVGKATVTVTFKTRYTGKLTATFKITPKATTMSKLTAASKGFTATWKKQATQTTGYQIQYSTSSKFTEKTTKTITVKSPKTVSTKVSKLKAKTTYYVRVRTYKTGGYYSAWSKALKVKTK